MEAHAGNIFKKRMSFVFEKTLRRISLSSKPVPVLYREYQYGLFAKDKNTKKATDRNTCDFLTQGRHMAQLPYIIMAVDAFVAGILCLLLPETNKAPTAEVLDGRDSHALPALLADKNDDDEDDQEKMTVV